MLLLHTKGDGINYLYRSSDIKVEEKNVQLYVSLAAHQHDTSSTSNLSAELEKHIQDVQWTD